MTGTNPQPQTPLIPLNLPATGFVRQAELIGRKARKASRARPARPATQGILGLSSSTLWRMVAAGTFPKPVKLSAGCTAWRCEDVRAWIEAKAAGCAA